MYLKVVGKSVNFETWKRKKNNAWTYSRLLGLISCPFTGAAAFRGVAGNPS